MSHWRRSTHQCLAEIAALQHTDEGGRGILKAIRDVFAIAYAPVGDSGGDRAQKRRVVLGCEFVVDVAAQSNTFARGKENRQPSRLNLRQ